MSAQIPPIQEAGAPWHGGRAVWLLHVACWAAWCASCSPDFTRTVPAHGSVCFEDGSPVAGAGVELAIEVNARRINARGVTDLDGRFTLSTFRQDDGAVPGKHAVVVVAPPSYAGGDVTKAVTLARVPENYGAYTTSPLSVVVPDSGGEVTIRIDR